MLNTLQSLQCENGDNADIESIKFLSSGKGIPFLSEEDLVNSFVNIVLESCSPNTKLVCELDCGNGIADVVLLKQRNDWKKYSDIRKISPRWVHSLIALPYKRKFDLEYFANLVISSLSTAKRVLESFVNAGFCERTKQGWIKVKQPRPAFSEIHAIEAKLKNWRRALYQATRYRDFAHRSTVLLDEFYSSPAIKNIEEFRRRGVGLQVLGHDGFVKDVYESISKKPKFDSSYWYAIAASFRSGLIS